MNGARVALAVRAAWPIARWVMWIATMIVWLLSARLHTGDALWLVISLGLSVSFVTALSYVLAVTAESGLPASPHLRIYLACFVVSVAIGAVALADLKIHQQ